MGMELIMMRMVGRGGVGAIVPVNLLCCMMSTQCLESTCCIMMDWMMDWEDTDLSRTLV